jgi:hypothetical protein
MSAGILITQHLRREHKHKDRKAKELLGAVVAQLLYRATTPPEASRDPHTDRPVPSNPAVSGTEYGDATSQLRFPSEQQHVRLCLNQTKHVHAVRHSSQRPPPGTLYLVSSNGSPTQHKQRRTNLPSNASFVRFEGSMPASGASLDPRLWGSDR